MPTLWFVLRAASSSSRSCEMNVLQRVSVSCRLECGHLPSRGPVHLDTAGENGDYDGEAEHDPKRQNKC
jgi:hypothetical protein